MKMKSWFANSIVGLAVLTVSMLAQAQSSAFTYQGLLADAGAPATGTYDLQFTLFNAETGGNPLTTANEIDSMGITNGLFTVELDFGCSFFDGNSRWIEIAVRSTSAGGEFVPLLPRQQILPSPYAIHANSVNASGIMGTIPATSLGTISSANLAEGSVGSAQLATNSVGTTQIITGSIVVESLATNIGVWDKTGTTVSYSGGSVGIGTPAPTAALDVNGTVKAAAFSGDGSGLTNLPVATAASAVNPMKAALLKWYVGNQTFSAGNGPAGAAFDGANIWVGPATA
jgi:hypothetical protein